MASRYVILIVDSWMALKKLLREFLRYIVLLKHILRDLDWKDAALSVVERGKGANPEPLSQYANPLGHSMIDSHSSTSIFAEARDLSINACCFLLPDPTIKMAVISRLQDIGELLFASRLSKARFKERRWWPRTRVESQSSSLCRILQNLTTLSLPLTPVRPLSAQTHLTMAIGG